MAHVIRIPPQHYIHVLDTNSNVTRLETGPKIFVKQDHEKVVSGDDPIKMVIIPPRHYVIINNPAVRDESKEVVLDRFGQTTIRHGDKEIRFSEQYGEPFPLYPGEKVQGEVEPLEIVPADTALLVEAERFFKDSEGNERQPGDLWYFKGPGTYYPRIEEVVKKQVNAFRIKPNQALKLRATKELVDGYSQKRKAGEEWLVREPGAYLPGVYEKIEKTLEAEVITDNQAIHLRAIRGFTDIYGIYRKAGEEWLVTYELASMHILDVYEEFVQYVQVTVVGKNQYCLVVDPWDEKTKNNRFGYKELRKGQICFFLQPGERLEGGIKNKYVLADDEALLLSARETLEVEGEEKNPGDRWMIYGPCSYIPPIEVEVLDIRKSIPLHMNEGIYVRDIRTGAVRTEFGKSYMLKAHEELWEMELSSVVEELLEQAGQGRANKTRVVSYKVPANSAVQVYNYKNKESRTIVGPDLVMLDPQEQFTVSVLSGGKPKRVGVIKTLHVVLGPDFSTDIVEVDTSDHARLRLQLSYNWHFEVDRNKPESFERVFKVRDFVGNICNFMASRVRGAVAGATFDQFHRESARIIRKSIFGLNEEGKVNDRFSFEENNLIITNVDIQSVEPVDGQTRARLQEYVTLAIENTTKMEEAKARHASERQAQESQGLLAKLRIENESNVEEENNKLYKLKSETLGVQTEGEATAEAKARAESSKILAQAQLEASELLLKAEKIQRDSELAHMLAKQELEVEYQRKIDELEIEKEKLLAEIESEKFKATIGSLGAETLVAISEAGPKTQAELLEGLGLQGYMMMDTNNPVNLFNTAQGLIGNLPQS